MCYGEVSAFCEARTLGRLNLKIMFNVFEMKQLHLETSSIDFFFSNTEYEVFFDLLQGVFFQIYRKLLLSHLVAWMSQMVVARV
jgi:hypothetical protein